MYNLSCIITFILINFQFILKHFSVNIHILQKLHNCIFVYTHILCIYVYCVSDDIYNYSMHVYRFIALSRMIRRLFEVLCVLCFAKGISKELRNELQKGFWKELTPRDAARGGARHGLAHDQHERTTNSQV